MAVPSDVILISSEPKMLTSKGIKLGGPNKQNETRDRIRSK